MKIRVIWDMPRADYQVVTGISYDAGNY